MQNLLRSWRASLELLLPNNIVPFLLVTLKTVTEVYWLIVRYFWWFLLLGFLVIEFFSHNFIIVTAWLIGWLTILVEASRPSVLKKDLEYFFTKALSCFPFAVLFFVSCCIPPVLFYAIATYFMFMMFFLCDANYRLYNMVLAPLHAAKLSLAIAPLYALLVLLLYASGSMLHHINMGIAFLLMLFVVLPLFVAIISRLYVLWIHKEYKEYYERCW